MKTFVAACAVLLALNAAAAAAEKFWFEPVNLSSSTLSPGTTGTHLIKAKAINNGTSPYSITIVTVSYSGGSGADIKTVRFFEDADGDWNTTGDRLQKGGNQIFTANKAIFQGYTIDLLAGATKYLFVTVDLSTAVTDENKVDGEITSPADIATTAPLAPSGTFALDSISDAAPHRINVIATTIISTPSFPTDVYAGVQTTFTVKAVDVYGNVDKGWKDSTFTIGATPGSEPGASPLGNTPVYSGSGVWLDAEDGQRQVGFTLMKAESNRKVRFSDTSLGTIDSGFITVAASSTARVALKTISNQTAGTPFQITIYAADIYGNPKTGHSGSISSISGNAVIGAAPDGTTASLPANYTWLGSEPSGEKALSVTLYKQYTGGTLSVSDNQLTGANSNSFNVAAGTVISYTLAPTVAGPYNSGTSVPYSVLAYDTWRNNASNYNLAASVTCTDTNATLPANPTFSSGAASFSVTLRTAGTQTVTLTEVSNPGVTGSTTAIVTSQSTLAKFGLTVPSYVKAGSLFDATITTLDEAGNKITSYSGFVKLSVDEPARITPDEVYITAGSWTGKLQLSAETLNMRLSVAGWGVTTRQAQASTVEVLGYSKARTYPTVFSPAKEKIKIRYHLADDRDVKISIYEGMHVVRELNFSAGSNGGRAGLNVVEWDGRDDRGDILSSRGYNILIYKGYEKERTGAIIRNF